MEDIDPGIYEQYGNRQNYDNMVIYQLREDDMLHNIFLDITGQTENKDGIPELDNTKTPLINVQGATTLMMSLRSAVSKVTSMSNLDDMDIRRLGMEFEEALHYSLCRHGFTDWEMKSYQAMDQIRTMFAELHFTTLNKASQGWMGNNINQKIQVSDVTHKTADHTPRPSISFPFSNNRRGAQ